MVGETGDPAGRKGRGRAYASVGILHTCDVSLTGWRSPLYPVRAVTFYQILYIGLQRFGLQGSCRSALERMRVSPAGGGVGHTFG